MVADLLGYRLEEVDLTSSVVGAVDYDVPSITTVARHWVSGTARTPAGDEPWRVFVKHVQAWHHSPFFVFVPEEARELARAGVPWRTEPLAYRSDLADRLPDGLSMPRALAVVDLEPDAAAIWLPEVPHRDVAWTPGRYERAAYLLGRLAASPTVAPLAGVGDFDWDVRHYVPGRVAGAVLPVVMSDEPWAAPGFGPLRDRVRAQAARVDELGTELSSFPHVTSHGDASPNNLLAGPGDDFVLIDLGFWMAHPLGFDLGQLVAGETQLGRGPDDLAAVDAACVAAYTRGLAEEGMVVDEDDVRRAHAVQLFLFAGVSALPDAPDMPAEQVARRAALASYSLDLLEATS